MQTQEIQKISSQVRRDILRMVHGCQSGHPGGSLGCTDLLVDLYFSTMNLKTDAAGKVVFDMDGTNEPTLSPTLLPTLGPTVVVENEDDDDNASFVNEAIGVDQGQLRKVLLMMCDTILLFLLQHPIFITYLTHRRLDLWSFCLNS